MTVCMSLRASNESVKHNISDMCQEHFEHLCYLCLNTARYRAKVTCEGSISKAANLHSLSLYDVCQV